jgi:xanthine dehydrogenase accessory factor
MRPGNSLGAAEADGFLLPAWPVDGHVNDIRPALAECRRLNIACVVATIIGLKGGGPRPVGTQMLIGHRRVVGFLSGGCVEADIVAHARSVMADGIPRHLTYGENSPWFDIRLLCGARMDVVLERVAPDDPGVSSLLAMTGARIPARLTTDGAARGCEELPVDAVSDGLCSYSDHADGFRLSRIYEPAIHLVVCGHDPTAMAVATLGRQLGYEVTLLTRRGGDEDAPLPGVHFERGRFGRTPRTLRTDRWCAIVAANHDNDADVETLATALATPAPYIGLLSSRLRADMIRNRLRSSAVAEDRLARLKMPIGLALGGKAPFEIAVAILAEIISVFRRGDPRASPMGRAYSAEDETFTPSRPARS